jgi:transcription elongation GreA/GreB family factor
MHGPLSEIGLIEVLQLLERGGRSGVLRLVGPDASAPRTVHIAGGRVVALEPDADDQAVTRALIARAEVASGQGEETTVSPAHREALRQELAWRALSAMVPWDRGRFDFQPSDPGTGPLDVSVESLVLALVDAEARRAELAEVLDQWQMIPACLPPDVVEQGAPITLDPLDWRIIDAVDGQRDVAGLAAHLGEPLEAVGEHVRTLVAATILQLYSAPESPAREPDRLAVSTSYDDAVERLRAQLRRAPGDGEAWRTLGLAEVGAGRFDRAVAAWQSWQEAVPSQAADATALIRAAHLMMEALRDTRE